MLPNFRMFIRSLRYAFQGLGFLLKENNFRIQLLAAMAVVAQAWYFELSKVEWCILLLCIGIVLMAEAFNTALETLCDKIEPDNNEIIGKVKDVSAAAVTLIALATLFIGVLLFLPHWKSCLKF